MRRLFSLTALFVLGLGLFVPAAGAETKLTVTMPTAGATITGTNVTISFHVEGIKIVPTTVPVAEAGKRPDANRPGEGHLHFMLDLQPLVVWERTDGYTFANVPPGDHQLTVEVVNNDHAPLSPPVVQQIRFRTAMELPATGTRSEHAAEGVLVVLGLLLLGIGALGRRQQLV